MIQNWIISDDTMTTKNYDGSMYPRVVNTMSALDVEDMSFVRVKIQKKQNKPSHQYHGRYSLSWGHERYQRVTNKGRLFGRIRQSRVTKKTPATDPCSSPADTRHHPMKDCIQLDVKLFKKCCPHCPAFL